MIKVTFIYHSCFVVETESAVLVFDYFKDPAKALKSATEKGKPIYVFASHAHGDHYSEEIFSWDSPNIHYIISDDIKVANKYKEFDITMVSPYSNYYVGDIAVETFVSTDEGVAFIVEVDGKTIYHAGDLHWWYWEERGADYVKLWGDKYKAELDKIKGRNIDLAFVLLDPRMKNGEGAGMAEFFEKVDANVVFPMHMWEDYAIVDRFKNSKWGEKYGEKLMRIKAPGDVFEC